jgi:hypothetical protein
MRPKPSYRARMCSCTAQEVRAVTPSKTVTQLTVTVTLYAVILLSFLIDKRYRSTHSGQVLTVVATMFTTFSYIPHSYTACC